MSIENKNIVKKEQLSGYREPNTHEQQKILQYMTRQLKKEGRLWKALKVVCVCIDAALILGLLGLGSTYSAREKVAAFIIAVLLTISIFCLNKAKRTDKVFLKRIENGEFQVLDCRAYKADFMVDAVNGAVIYIYNEYEEYCDERFWADYWSVKEWQENPMVPFLLMRAVRGKVYHYEMFSEKKLDGK